MAGNNGQSLRFYEADSGEIHAIRVRDTTLTLQVNSGIDQPIPSGPVTSPWWFRGTKGSTEYGGQARQVGVCFTTTAPADLEVGPTYFVTVFQPNTFNLTTLRSLVSYQGQEAIVVAKRREEIYPGV